MTIHQNANPSEFFRAGAKQVFIEQCNYSDGTTGFYTYSESYWPKMITSDFSRVAVFKVKAKEVQP